MNHYIFPVIFSSSTHENPEKHSELLVKTRNGKIRGTYLNKYVIAWLGVPYAEPPIGKH